MERGERVRLQEAMVRLADGDRSAFHPAFEILWPLLRRFAGRFLHGAADADDLAQQALLKVFLHAARFEQDGDALSWALAITANECRAARRKMARRREEQMSRAAVLPAASPGPEAFVVARDLEDAARETLASLPESDVRTILASIRGEGASSSGVPSATFRKRLQRALARLRQRWRRTHGAV